MSNLNLGDWRISRRTALRGLGVAVGLPLLDAMGFAADPPGKTPATRAPVRMAFLYVPNGINMAEWRPKKGSAALPSILEPLKPVINDVLVIAGLGNDIANGERDGKGGGGHAKPTGAFLTSSIPHRSGTINNVGISVDQVAAQQIGAYTTLPSIELGIDPGQQGGECDTGFSCTYTSNISWRSPSTPMAKQNNPKAVFARLFADVKQGNRGGQAGGEAALQKSVLDLVNEDAKALRAALGGSDQRKLEEYLDSLRALEQRIQHAATRPAADSADAANAVPELKIPDGIPKDFVEHVRLMMDLIVVAFQTDRTRIATFMLANDTSGRTYPSIGVTTGHHDTSHHGGDPVKLESIRKINTHHVEQFAYLLGKLRAIKEGKGTLLDNCMLMYGSPIADGDRHNPNDLPILLAGSGGGTIRSGRSVQCSENLSNLYLAMLARMGVKADSFGDSTGLCKGLL